MTVETEGEGRAPEDAPFERSMNPVAGRRYRRGRSPEGDQHVLLRKEVIQPHLPVQLPCYDLTPVMSHTLNARPIGEATRLRVQLTPMV